MRLERAAPRPRSSLTRAHAALAAEGGQLSLLRTIVVVALLAFVLFEVGALVINRYQAADVAQQAAQEANLVYFGGRSEEAAEKRAREFVEENRAQFVDLAVDTQQRRLSVTAEKQARTILVHRIGQLASYRTARATESVPLR